MLTDKQIYKGNGIVVSFDILYRVKRDFIEKGQVFLALGILAYIIKSVRGVER